MRKSTGLAVGLLAFALEAQAADLPVKAPIYKAPAPVFSWSGLYFGANVGYGVARNPSSQPNNVPGSAPETFTLQPAGAFGGLQLGYNWQLTHIVLGVEADAQWSSQRDSGTCLEQFCSFNPAPAGFSSSFEQKMPWFATARARAGYANGPLLSYVTGGAAFGKAQTDISVIDAATTGSLHLSSNRSGWTFGGGVEAALGNGFSAKAEYLYVDLGSQSGAVAFVPPSATPINFDTRLREHIFRAGLNYNLNGGGAMPVPAAAMQWSGLYVGGNLGFGVARNPSTFFDNAAGLGPLNETFKLAPAGYSAGALAGYNVQFGNLVTGVEGDIQWSGQKDDQACIAGCDVFFLGQSASIVQKLTWFSTLRGRLGYGVGPTLFYVTGGAAFGGIKTDINETIAGFAPGSFSFSHTNSGWTAGAGIEGKFELFGLLGPNWSARTEYLYVDLGSVTDNYTYATEAHSVSSSIRDHIWRSALIYRFGSR